MNFIVGIYNNLASISEEKQRYEEAILLYEKGLSLLNSSVDEKSSQKDKFLEGLRGEFCEVLLASSFGYDP